MLKCCIFSVKHFAVHDGSGIRTTLFLKGCPLSCLWCHNPEGKEFKPQLALYSHKCTNCGACKSVCPQNAHIFENGHIIDRTKCIVCGECEKVCLNDALTLFGKWVTVEEIMPQLLEDRDFYEASGGGVTLSGGECLSQADFCQALLKELKKERIHTAVDTCGFVSKEAFDKVLPYTDVFLYDIKAFSSGVHEACTGVKNDIIWDNLQYISEKGAKCCIRIPFVPEFNEHEIEPIAKKISEYNNILSVEVLPYHNFSGSKYDALQMENTMPNVPMPEKEQLEKAKGILKKYGLRVV